MYTYSLFQLKGIGERKGLSHWELSRRWKGVWLAIRFLNWAQQEDGQERTFLLRQSMMKLQVTCWGPLPNNYFFLQVYKWGGGNFWCSNRELSLRKKASSKRLKSLQNSASSVENLMKQGPQLWTNEFYFNLIFWFALLLVEDQSTTPQDLTRTSYSKALTAMEVLSFIYNVAS